MKTCPICATKIEKENQEYCLTCAWEFEYFFDELSEDEKKKYLHRIALYSSIYSNSKDTEYIKKLEAKILELKKDKKVELKEKENSKEKKKEIAPLVIEKQKTVDKIDSISTKKIIKIGKTVTIDNLMYYIKLSKLFGTKTWIEAMEESSKIDFMHHNDWRLPTRVELKNLFSEDKVISKFFANFNDKSSFWTSEERSSKHAWEIPLKNNMLNWGMKTNKNYVIYVRDIKEEDS